MSDNEKPETIIEALRAKGYSESEIETILKFGVDEEGYSAEEISRRLAFPRSTFDRLLKKYGPADGEEG